MEFVFSDLAEKDLANLYQDMKAVYLIHLEKIQSLVPSKHMKYGIPCYGEKITRHARTIYKISEKQNYILLCFSCHKEYELWYNSYK